MAEGIDVVDVDADVKITPDAAVAVVAANMEIVDAPDIAEDDDVKHVKEEEEEEEMIEEEVMVVVVQDEDDDEDIVANDDELFKTVLLEINPRFVEALRL